MRRMFQFGVILSLSIAMAAGCGKKDQSKGKAAGETQKPPAEAKPPKPQEPAQPAAIKALSVAAVGFATPESVLYDAANDRYLVSNINGSPFTVDDNGFISHVSPSGDVVSLKWIDGGDDKVTLNAPKGMAIAGGVLYVADITAVRMFDLATGEPKGEIAIEGASFLNDMVAGKPGPDGAIPLYVSDTGVKEGFVPVGTDAIYRIDDGKAAAIAKDAALAGPNGLAIDKSGLWVVSFGSGELYQLDSDGQKAAVVELPKGQLDGIVAMPGGDFLISSWAAAAIYRGPASGPFATVIDGVTAPADIGYDTKRGRVLIPRFNDNAIDIYEVK